LPAGVGIWRNPFPRVFGVVQKRLAVRVMVCFARSLSISSAVVALELGTNRVIVERI
jgi:hypothetical protein